MSPARKRATAWGNALIAGAPGLFRDLPRQQVERTVMTFANLIVTAPKILECTEQSIANTVAIAASAGWDFGPPLHKCHAVPFKKSFKKANGDWDSVYECTLIPGWRGMADLVMRSGKLKKPLSAHEVYEGESFEVVMDDGELKIKHGYQSDNPYRQATDWNHLTHVYLVAELLDGTKVRGEMSRQAIELHRDTFCAKNAYYTSGGKQTRNEDSPWWKNPIPMGLKTLILMMIHRNRLPVSITDKRDIIEPAEQVERIEAVEGEFSFVSDETPALPQTSDPNEGGIDPFALAKEQYRVDLDKAEADSSLLGAGIAFDRFVSACGNLWSPDLDTWAVAAREATIKTIHEQRRNA